MNNKTLNALMAALLSITLFPAVSSADNHGPPFVTSFSCNYHAGKGADDLRAVVADWQEAVADMDEMDAYFAMVMTPIWSGFDTDFWWIGSAPSLMDMVEGGDAYIATDAGQALNAAFGEVADCSTQTYFSNMVHMGFDGPPEVGGSGVAEGFACTLRDDHRFGDLDGPDAYFSSVMDEMEGQVASFRWRPAWGASEADVVYLNFHSSMSAMAELGGRVQASEHGAMLDGWYSELLDCASGVFGTMVVKVGEG